MSNIRILLLCGNRFALQTLQELAFFNQLAAVVIPQHCDEWLEHATAALAGSTVPIVPVTKENYEATLQEAFGKYQANVGLMVTFSFKIPASVFTIPEKGFYNVHPGPLPAYRGPDPVFYQIRNREKLAGVTVHVVDEKFDNGAIVAREQIRLLPTDTYGLLSQKLSLVGTKLVHTLVKLLDFDTPLPVKQQDATKASYQKRQGAKEVSINWELMNASEIVALANACNPWNKGASARVGLRIIKLLQARITDQVGQTGPAGTVLSLTGHEAIIACKDGSAIAVSIFSTDEGFITGDRLQETGVVPGFKFESTV